MHKKDKKLYIAIAKIINQTRKDKGIKYTELCYENDIAMSTYDDIVNAKTKASYLNIAKIIKGLGLNFKEFGELLDKELGEDFKFIDE